MEKIFVVVPSLATSEQNRLGWRAAQMQFVTPVP
jgi:hypothetical protein